MEKRILVIANKHWEVDPLVNAIVSDRVIPRRALGVLTVVNHPFWVKDPARRRPDQGTEGGGQPRIVIQLPSAEVDGNMVGGCLEVWCVEDLMDPSASSSSTLKKAGVPTQMLRHEPGAEADLVIAFGTAAGPPEISLNGCVIVGRDVFIHDPFADVHDPNLHWKVPRPDQVIKSERMPRELFSILDKKLRSPAEACFLRVPVEPSDPPSILVGSAYAALTNVNITNYDDYAWADPELLDQFSRPAWRRSQAGSIETTHGLIREEIGDEIPFMYVSGVANKIGRYGYEVAPRLYAQDFVAAHNAGVTMAWLIPELLGVLVGA